MSDTEAAGAKGKTGWTDRQRLAYFFNLVNFSKVKLDYANAPRPEGKSVGACQIMVHRLKGTLKDDVEALRAGTAMPEDTTPKKAAKSTPRKRKGVEANGEAEDTPTKRGRKKKAAVAEPADNEELKGAEEAKVKVKAEVVGEEGENGED